MAILHSMPYGHIDTSLILVTKHHNTKRKRNDLTLTQKLEIITLSSHKVSQRKVATQIDCSQSTVSKILPKILTISTQIVNVIGKLKIFSFQWFAEMKNLLNHLTV